MRTTNLTKQEARAIAKEAKAKLVWWNTKSGAFNIGGTQTQIATFRALVNEAMGGIAYQVTDNGSYPWYGERQYRPMDKRET